MVHVQDCLDDELPVINIIHPMLRFCIGGGILDLKKQRSVINKSCILENITEKALTILFFHYGKYVK